MDSSGFSQPFRIKWIVELFNIKIFEQFDIGGDMGFVAGQAEILAGPDEAVWRIVFGIAVAEGTCAGCNRRMNILILFDPLGMTFGGDAGFRFVDRLVNTMEPFVLRQGINHDQG